MTHSKLIPEITHLQVLDQWQAAEFRSAAMRLGIAAMLGSKAAEKALAEVTADVCIERALDPDAPGVANRYQATVEATLMACMRKPGRDADLPAVGSFG
ncbi:MAG: hypothetical protein MIL41_24585 [Hyphomicrobiales bacterium]